MELWLRLGVTEEERAWPQKVLLSVRIGCLDLSPAAKTDALEKTVDYARICQSIRDLAQARPRCLLESLAWEVATAILQEPLVQEVEVEVRKFPLPSIGCVSLRIQRSKSQDGRAAGPSQVS